MYFRTRIARTAAVALAALGIAASPATGGVDRGIGVEPYASPARYGPPDPWFLHVLSQARSADHTTSDGRSRLDEVHDRPQVLGPAGRMTGADVASASVSVGFDWADAGVGAGGALALVVLLVITRRVVGERRGGSARDLPSSA